MDTSTGLIDFLDTSISNSEGENPLVADDPILILTDAEADLSTTSDSTTGSNENLIVSISASGEAKANSHFSADSSDDNLVVHTVSHGLDSTNSCKLNRGATLLIAYASYQVSKFIDSKWPKYCAKAKKCSHTIQYGCPYHLILKEEELSSQIAKLSNQKYLLQKVPVTVAGVEQEVYYHYFQFSYSNN